MFSKMFLKLNFTSKYIRGKIEIEKQFLWNKFLPAQKLNKEPLEKKSSYFCELSRKSGNWGMFSIDLSGSVHAVGHKLKLKFDSH